jgi:hypothetical protein
MRAQRKGERRVYRRGDGVIAIRRPSRWRQPLISAAAVALVLAPLVFALAFVLPPVLLPVPTLVFGLGVWLLFRNIEPAEPPADPPARPREVIPMRSVRRRRGIVVTHRPSRPGG